MAVNKDYSWWLLVIYYTYYIDQGGKSPAAPVHIQEVQWEHCHWEEQNLGFKAKIGQSGTSWWFYPCINEALNHKEVKPASAVEDDWGDDGEDDDLLIAASQFDQPIISPLQQQVGLNQKFSKVWFKGCVLVFETAGCDGCKSNGTS